MSRTIKQYLPRISSNISISKGISAGVLNIYREFVLLFDFSSGLISVFKPPARLISSSQKHVVAWL